MATELNLTSSGCSGSAVHTKPSTPDYNLTFTLSASLQLSVVFKDYGKYSFNYDVGFVAEGANNVSVSKTDRLSFGSTPNGGNFGYGNNLTLSGDLSSLSFPITLYFTCGGCNAETTGGTSPIEWQNDAKFIIYDARHTHIGDISGPTLSSITATSITASGGEEVCLVTNGTDGTWYKSPHTFTGLNKATTYSFKCRKKCPDCPEDIERSSTASAKTWGITGSCLSSGAKSLTYTATYTKGDGYADYNPAITYYLYESKDGNYIKGPIQKNNGESATFTGLDPSKTYYCKACTNGIDDNWMWIDGNTKASASISGSGGDVSAKSLRASVSWNVGEASSVECTVTCNGTSKTLSTNGGNIGFTGLDPGSNYMVSYSIVSTYEYTYTVIKNGELVTETDYDTHIDSGSFNLTTKIASFGDCESTSKIIRFKSNSNYNDNTMEHRLNSSDWVEVEQDTYTLYNNLKHNTSYTIYTRIKDCYAFNSSGNITSVNDSVISKTVNTLLLSLNASISEEHQHSLITLWQAYVDGNKTDKDAIDGTEFAFTKVSTRAKKSNPPYQASEVIEGVDGNTNANYQLDKKVYSNNLTWYYCEYIVSAEITDGYNKVNAEITAHTLFPAKWIYSGGQWHRYMGHVYTNGKWVPAPEFVYTDNYIEPNGE